MGISIKIGEAKISYGKDDHEYGRHCNVQVERIKEKNPDKYQGDNEFSSSYTGFAYCLERTGLDQVYDKCGYKECHPDIVPIQQEDLEEIQLLKQQYIDKFNSGVLPAIPEEDRYHWDNIPDHYITPIRIDYAYQFLVWQEYWTRRALSQCTYPVIQNS